MQVFTISNLLSRQSQMFYMTVMTSTMSKQKKQRLSPNRISVTREYPGRIFIAKPHH